MNHLDLFSGLGGFALAARTVWGEAHHVAHFVEIDPYCRRVLAKHWPTAPQHDDARSFYARPLLGTIDLLTGGYPCQPFSIAGQRKGAQDDRHLWPEVLRVVRECRPRWCLFENVAGHVTLGLDRVLSDLEDEGYTCWPLVIPACATNAHHRRDRVWIVAHAEGHRRDEPEWEDGEPSSREGGEGRVDALGGVAHVADAGGAGREERHAPRLADGQGQRTGRGDAASPLPAWTGGDWSQPPPAEPRVRRVADGLPGGLDGHRLKALGNAVVPAVAAEIMRAIQAADASHENSVSAP